MGEIQGNFEAIKENFQESIKKKIKKMENAAVRYFRTRYPTAYLYFGDQFPFTKQVQSLVNDGIDYMAPVQKEFDELWGDGKISAERYMDLFQEALAYQSNDHKLEFEPLTLDIVRRHVGEKIMIYDPSDDPDPIGPLGPTLLENIQDRWDAKKVFSDWVIFPTGRTTRDNKEIRVKYRLLDDEIYANIWRGNISINPNNTVTWVQKGKY